MCNRFTLKTVISNPSWNENGLLKDGLITTTCFSCNGKREIEIHTSRKRIEQRILVDSLDTIVHSPNYSLKKLNWGPYKELECNICDKVLYADKGDTAFHCSDCKDYDLCGTCIKDAKLKHSSSHVFISIET